MTVLRLINPAFRAGLLIAAGAALLIGPVLLDAGSSAIVAGMVAGIVAIALGVSGTESGGRGTLPVSAQAIYDRGLALCLLVAAVLFAAAGEAAASTLFAAAGLLALVVTTITRYSARPI